MVYACFVAKMSKMAFTRFGGQFQFEKSMLGRLDNSGAGPGAFVTFGGTEEIPDGSSHYINHQSIGNAIAAVILLNYNTTNEGQLFCTCIQDQSISHARIGNMKVDKAVATEQEKATRTRRRIQIKKNNKEKQREQGQATRKGQLKDKPVTARPN